MRKEKCRICGEQMKHDDAPGTGWYCTKCGYRKDDDGKEWIDNEIRKNLKNH